METIYNGIFDYLKELQQHTTLVEAAVVGLVSAIGYYGIKYVSKIKNSRKHNQSKLETQVKGK